MQFRTHLRPRRRPPLLALFFLLVVFPSLGRADGAPDVNLAGSQRIKVVLLADHQSLQPSDDPARPAARIGVLLKIEKDWHTYWENSGDAAIPTRVTWRLPDGWRAGELHWPAPQKFQEKGNITTYGYRDEVLIWTELFAPEIIPNDQSVTLGAKVSWLVCKDICVPGQQVSELEIPFTTSRPLQPSEAYPLFDRFAATSPRPFSGLGASKLFARAALETGVVTEGDKRYLTLVLKDSAIAPEISLATSAQLFPRTTSSVKWGQAEGTVSGTDIIARIPFSLIGTPPSELSGIAVFSAEVAGTKTDSVFNWQTPLDHPIEPSGAALSFSELSFRTGHPDKKPTGTPASEASSTGLIQALLAAFFAGLLLNLMPCVLPIISIKIMGFVSQADQSRSHVLRSSLFFAAGILSSFFVLALVLISLRGVGLSLGWGFQFQFPQFVAALLFIVFFLSLALFDFYSVNLPFMQTANKAASQVRAPFARHFFDGVLATALSTPCTAPVLGTALVFAFSQPPVVTVAIFLTIGLGLALPYVYLSSHPALLDRLPAPGQWMFQFRQTMGFFLLGTCAWLLFVLHDLTEKGVVWAVVLMLVLFFCLWMRKSLLESKPERGRSLAFNLIFYGALFGSAYLLYPSLVAKRGQAEKGLISWVPFSEAVLDDARAKKQPVFIDFTASWCITCKFNEFRLIETRETAELIKRLNILPVKADWTAGDESITNALRRYGAEGVPLYVVLSPHGKEPVVLSTLPGKSSLFEAFQSASTP